MTGEPLIQSKDDNADTLGRSNSCADNASRLGNHPSGLAVTCPRSSATSVDSEPADILYGSADKVLTELGSQLDHHPAILMEGLAEDNF